MIHFPAAIPEIPVADLGNALAYYEEHLGFVIDWRDNDGGIAGISKGSCRLFLANASFRESRGNSSPTLVWLNMQSKDELDQLYEQWTTSGAMIISAPEDKSWNLREFTASDLDGNRMRIFYDFTNDV